MIVCGLMLSIGGYFVYQQFFNQFSLEFSEYYQQAEDFEEIEPLLNQYFKAVQSAYDRSDKENLETFVLDDSYEAIADVLNEMNKRHSDKMGSFFSMSDAEKISYNAASKLYLCFLKTNLIIIGKEVLLIENDNHLYKPDWFIELNDTLLECYNEYANGNSEF